MSFSNLSQDRFLKKDPNQNDQTKGAAYSAVNPVPKQVEDSSRKRGQANGSEDAPNILTGTVITSCFIQTSALPSRVEIEGNDITFFDDTYSLNGKLLGDTSRLVFTTANGGNSRVDKNIQNGFIIQKRALIGGVKDNVFELFSPDNAPNSNYIFIGRRGTGDERNIKLVEIAPDHRTDVGDAQGYINGVFRVRVSRNGADEDYRDGLYIFDRGTESSTREGTVNWLVAAGEGGQVRLSYMPNRDGNPLVDATFDIFVSADGVTFFGLPEDNPGGSGRVWNDGGILKIT